MNDPQPIERPPPDSAERIVLWSRRYRGALIRYLQRRAPADADVEDLVQEVFLRLARRADLSDIANAEGYLFQAAANLLRDEMRRRALGAGYGVEAYEEACHGIEDRSPERVIAGRQSLQELLIALEELPQRAREAFVLFRFENLSQAEIAQRLGVSASSVEKYMMKAYAHLLKRLGPPS
jgi:RNA polymerase sigma-70 factor (ECF subfamily)